MTHAYHQAEYCAIDTCLPWSGRWLEDIAEVLMVLAFIVITFSWQAFERRPPKPDLTLTRAAAPHDRAVLSVRLLSTPVVSLGEPAEKIKQQSNSATVDAFAEPENLPSAQAQGRKIIHSQWPAQEVKA